MKPAGMVGRAAGELVALGVPGLDDVGVGGGEDPGLGAGRGARRAGTTSSIRPAALAAAGASILPSSRRGAAAMTPSMRTRRVVPPAPGKMPMRISGRPTRALGVSAMKRRWQARPISVPMPAERPGAAQAMGLPPFSVFGSMPARSIFRSSRWIAMMPSKRPRAGSAPACFFMSASRLRSMPPAKSGLAEVMTMPLTAGSARARVDGGVELGDALVGQDVHRAAGQVPGDGGDAVGVDVEGEDRHVRPPECRRRARPVFLDFGQSVAGIGAYGKRMEPVWNPYGACFCQAAHRGPFQGVPSR